MSFRPLAFIDTAAMTALLMTKHKDKWAAEDDGRETIALRELASDSDDEVATKDTALLKEWRSAMGVLNQVRALGPALNEGKVKFGMVWLERLPPGVYTPWSVDEGPYADAHYRLELCLIPSPQGFSYSGNASMVPPVGMLLGADNRVLYSAVNFGAFPWVRLIIDVRKLEIGEDDTAAA